MILSARRARKLKGTPIANARIIDVPEDIKQLVFFLGQVDKIKLEALHKRFQAFDSDSSSFIDSTELTPLLQSLGFNPTEEHVQEILSAFDTDKTGTLTFGEFVEVWAYYCQEAQSEAEIIRRSFTFLLQNDSRAISFSEFRDTMLSTGNPLTEGEIRRFFSLCDDESDGILRLDEFLKVLYNQPSLDMSLTRMSDTRHDRPEVIRDMFAKSSRVQRRSLASSISAQSTSRPWAVVPALEIPLCVQQCANLPADTHRSNKVNQSVQSDVSQRLCLPATFEAIVEDCCEEISASTIAPSTQSGSGLLRRAKTIESGEHKSVQCEIDKLWKDTACAQMQHDGRDRLSVDQLSQGTSGSSAATLCDCHGQGSCGTPVGPVLVPCAYTHHLTPNTNRVVTSTSRDEPLLCSLTPRKPVPSSGLPSLPSQIHRKLEAMSATIVATPIRTHSFDSSR